MSSLLELMERYRQGLCPVFAPGPFLPVAALRARRLRFNRLLQDAADMATAALLKLEMGFEATVVPFDVNVEAELIGCPVNFHEEVDGAPVYPTIGERWIETENDFVLPETLMESGRMKAITSAIGIIKKKAAGRAAVGAVMLGPFTLAGQVMDPDRMFVTVLKKPDIIQGVLAKLTELLMRVRNLYLSAGVDFVIIQEGGATGVSPKVFKNTVFPALQLLLGEKTVPHILSLSGRAERYIPMLIETGANGIGIDQESDLPKVSQQLPEDIPLMATCGQYDMLANATPKKVRETVWACLSQGVTQACPPADIYPPARPENIAAFVEAHRSWPQWLPFDNDR